MADSLRRRMMMGQSGGETDPAKMYLTTRFVGEGTCSITFSTTSMGAQVYYSVDNGRNWSYYTNSFTVDSQHPVLWKASGVYAGSSDGIGYFSATGLYEVYGNIMSMQSGDNFATSTTIANSYQFLGLFKNDTHLVSAESLVLPATTLTTYCYSQMFYGCTNLVSAPQLPATTLTTYCYQGMFRGCSALTTAPDLSATSLASNCYQEMFYNCTSLLHAPKLPATTLATSCYQSMFRGCTSLVAAPILQAGTLVSNCYNQMFYGCSSLYNVSCWANSQSIPSGALTNWLSGVKSGGCFIAKAMGANYPSGASGVPSNWRLQYMHGIIYDLSGYYTYKNDAINTGIKLFSYDTVHSWDATYSIELEATVIETPSSSYNTFISCGNLDINISSSTFNFNCEPFIDSYNYSSIQAGSKISAVAHIADNPDDTSWAGFSIYTNGSYAGGSSISTDDVNDSYESESVLRIGNSSIKVIIHYFRIYYL